MKSNRNTANQKRIETLVANFSSAAMSHEKINLQIEKRNAGQQFFEYICVKVMIGGFQVGSMIDCDIGSITQRTFDKMVFLIARSYEWGYRDGRLDYVVGSDRLAA